MIQYLSLEQRLDIAIDEYKKSQGCLYIEDFKSYVLHFQQQLIDYADQYKGICLDTHVKTVYVQDETINVEWEGPNADISMSFEGDLVVEVDLHPYWHEDFSVEKHFHHFWITESLWKEGNCQHITNEQIGMCFSPEVYHQRTDPDIRKEWDWDNIKDSK